jgi:diguanylate cyclase (GGDEF)-like protein
MHDPADIAERNGRIAGLGFLLVATYTAVVLPWVGDAQQRSIQLGVMALLGISAAVCFLVPWRVLPKWADELPAAWAIALLGVGLGAFGGVLGAYVGALAVFLAYSGLTGGWATLRLALLAELFLLAATLLGNQDSERMVVAATVVVAAVIGRFVAMTVSWNQTAGSRLRTLRAALAELSDVTTETAAANVLASAATQLLEADDAVVLLTEHPGSCVLAGRGASREDLLVRPIRIDMTREQSGAAVSARSGQTLFVPDSPSSPVVSQRLATQFDTMSTLFLPIPGEGGAIGTVMIWWHLAQRSVDPFAQQVAEMLLAPAGQILERLRHRSQQDTDTMKDPLTGIGNRRRFDAGLTQLPVGGAVLMFDLDDFKHVNSLHGLDAGDETLRAFAAALRRCVRDNDIVTRFDSDRFGVILPLIASPIAGGVIIERLQRIWRAPHGCAFSVGIAIRTEEETPAETVARSENDLQATKRLKLR